MILQLVFFFYCFNNCLLFGVRVRVGCFILVIPLLGAFLLSLSGLSSLSEDNHQWQTFVIQQMSSLISACQSFADRIPPVFDRRRRRKEQSDTSEISDRLSRSSGHRKCNIEMRFWTISHSFLSSRRRARGEKQRHLRCRWSDRLRDQRKPNPLSLARAHAWPSTLLFSNQSLFLYVNILALMATCCSCLRKQSARSFPWSL